MNLFFRLNPPGQSASGQVNPPGQSASGQVNPPGQSASGQDESKKDAGGINLTDLVEGCLQTLTERKIQKYYRENGLTYCHAKLFVDTFVKFKNNLSMSWVLRSSSLLTALEHLNFMVIDAEQIDSDIYKIWVKPFENNYKRYFETFGHLRFNSNNELYFEEVLSHLEDVFHELAELTPDKTAEELIAEFVSTGNFPSLERR